MPLIVITIPNSYFQEKSENAPNFSAPKGYVS